MTSSASSIDARNPNYVGKLGAGRIDAEAFVRCVAAKLGAPSPAPTQSPTCAEVAPLTVSILTDEWPNEITWDLTRGGAEVASGGPYTEVFTLEEAELPLCVGGEYLFSVRDSFGDGLSHDDPNYVGPDGFVTLTMSGAVIFQGSAYGFGTSHAFVASLLEPSPAPTEEPSPAPTEEPSPAPTKWPLGSPAPTPACPTDCADTTGKPVTGVGRDGTRKKKCAWIAKDRDARCGKFLLARATRRGRV